MFRKDKYWWIIIILVLAGFFLRSYLLGVQSYWIDESYSINAAQAILDHGYPILDSGVIYGRGLPFHYVLAFFMMIFGNNEFSMRILSAIFGSLFIPLIYTFTKRVTTRNIALATAFSMTFLTLEIAWARQARMYAMLQLFYFLSLYLFFLVLTEKNHKKIISTLFVISSLITIMVNTLGYSLIIVCSIYSIVHLKSGKSWHTLLNDLRKGTIKYRYHLMVIGIGILFFLVWKLDFIIATLGTNTSNQLVYLFYLETTYGLFYFLAVIGIFLIRSKEEFFLLLSALVPLYFICFHQLLLHFRYLFILIPVIFLFAWKTIMLFANKFSKIRRELSVVFLVFVGIAVLSTGLFTFIPKSFYSLEMQTPQPDFKGAYTVVFNMVQEDDLLISSYSPIAEIYCKKPDYVFDFSLTGLPGTSMKACFNCTYDQYNRVPLITDAENLKSIMKYTKGYIVVDRLVSRKLDESFIEIFRNSTLIYTDYRNMWSEIWVYRWDNSRRDVDTLEVMN